MKKVYLILPEFATDMRLDRFLRKTYPLLTQGLLEKLCRKGSIRINGKKIKTNYRLTFNETLTHPEFPIQEEKKTAAPSPGFCKKIKQCILFENELFMALNKPHGVAVQGGSGITNPIDEALQTLYASPRLVHRLDKDTSGLLIVAKTLAAAQELAQLFKDRSIKKTYYAVTLGRVKKKTGTLDWPLKKKRDHKTEKVYVDHHEGKEAHTHYTVVSYDPKMDVSLLHITPFTGRLHQIRVHCAEMGHPILGDYKYGGKEAQPFGKKVRLHLHSYQMTFRLFGQDYCLKAPISDDFILQV